MTFLERKLISHFLSMLSSILSKRCCNDFDLYEAGLSEDEVRELIEIFNEWDRIKNPVGFEPRQLDKHIIEDWLLASMLSDRVNNS